MGLLLCQRLQTPHWPAQEDKQVGTTSKRTGGPSQITSRAVPADQVTSGRDPWERDCAQTITNNGLLTDRSPFPTLINIWINLRVFPVTFQCKYCETVFWFRVLKTNTV